MREVYLVRHAHCEKSGSLLGQADVPLTPRGYAQARVLADRFAINGMDRLLTSDLRRAVQTAQCIAERTGVSVETDPQLREITYGDWDGLYWEQIENTSPEAARRKLQNWKRWTPPRGELFESFLTRVTEAWNRIRTSHHRVTLVVAHQGVNSVLAAAASGSHSTHLTNFRQDYGDVFRICIP